MELAKHQREAVDNLENGNILWGGTGSGKTAAVLTYWAESEHEHDLYVITTARKRDSLDWEGEAVKLGLSTKREYSRSGEVLTVDSWNNIRKYEDITGAFFVFDEQRVVGSGAWVKSFYKIAKNNRWVLLSATPGDSWLDYIPVFVANGFYRNATDFKREHVIYEPFRRFPIVKAYVNVKKLEKLRDQILVEMPFVRNTTRCLNWLEVGYDHKLFGYAWKKRWNVFEDRPLKDVSELFFILRKIVNTDPSRLELLLDLMKVHPKMIVFYNFNYELAELRKMNNFTTVAEWNGHRKEPIPDTDEWLYLVQYRAGAEAWNCTQTDAMVFYSLPYSYKNFVQAQGRIDRLDTPFSKLYYYVMSSNSFIDRAIKDRLMHKKSFNERAFAIKNLQIEEWLV